ncbi:MAG: 8-oxo-dGTP diphosphatase [Lachnospiraceae bacterium]|nr:8-oxo-dGTP diphosphatase [Lachnospiraceae bacterium]
MLFNSTLCYLIRDDSYLMLHRTKKEEDLNSGKWIGVGGKFEPAESPEECVIREVFEETGYTLDDMEYRGIVTFVYGQYAEVTEYMHIFTSEHFSGKQKICDEGDLKWIKISEVPKLDIWEGDRIFLDLLKNSASFFSLKLHYDDDGNLVDHEEHIYGGL